MLRGPLLGRVLKGVPDGHGLVSRLHEPWNETDNTDKPLARDSDSCEGCAELQSGSGAVRRNELGDVANTASRCTYKCWGLDLRSFYELTTNIRQQFRHRNL